MLSSTSLRYSHSPLPSPSPSPFSETLHPVKPLARIPVNGKIGSSGSLASAASLIGSSRRAPVPASQATAESSATALLRVSTASDVVREFYDGINRRDLAAVEPLIAEDCVYEDLIFSSPFVGREAILEFFKKFTESISKDLQFAIDDISSEDTSAVGVTWHLDWQGRPFPFSKGCSFYRLEVVDGKRQIVYGRDCVEPAAKPGEIALVLIGGVTWILQRFPHLAERL